jgi:hypothetical protein
MNVSVSYNRYETKVAQAFYNVFAFRKPKKNGVFSLVQKGHRLLNVLKGFYRMPKSQGYSLAEPLPDWIDWVQDCQDQFLTGVCESYYGQGLEDALKALPPLFAELPEYMDGYCSLQPLQALAS